MRPPTLHTDAIDAADGNRPLMEFAEWSTNADHVTYAGSETSDSPDPVDDVNSDVETGSGTDDTPDADDDADGGPIEFSEWVNDASLALSAADADVDDADIVTLEFAAKDDEESLIADTPSRVRGTLISVLLHLAMVLVLSSIMLPNDWEPHWDAIDSTFSRPIEVEDIEQVVDFELIDPNDRDLAVQKIVNAASVGQSINENPQPETAPTAVDITLREARQPMYDIPEGQQLDDRLVVKGTTGESIVQMESALDRVTWEIGQNLAEGRVLVVWLLDASGSLKTQRDIVANRLKRIYGELDALDTNTEPMPRPQQPLLTGVVAYGEQTRFLTKEPTHEFSVIHDAVVTLERDDSGVENIFTAVTQVLRVWGDYRIRHARRIMLVVVTDESGDDFDVHVPAIAQCLKYGAKAYVIGPNAVFGRRQGVVPYIAPEDGKTYQLPVDLGPETAMYEYVRLPFWFSGPQYDYLSSGFAPYGLARLVGETGGIYFTSNMTTMAGLTPLGTFDANQTKPFEPDYSFASRADYERDLTRHPLRFAVVQAARLSRQFEAEGTPPLDLRVNPRNYLQVASDAQKTAARTQYMVDAIVQAFPPGVSDQYELEPSFRWRMAYDLSLGRLLALQVRAAEYNAALADLKSSLGDKDIETKSNHWIFQPDNSINFATNERRTAGEAELRLQRVIDSSQGTPFAVLAERELRHPLGIRVIQRFIPPPKPRPPRQPTSRPSRPQFARPNNPSQTGPPPRPVPPKLPKL